MITISNTDQPDLLHRKYAENKTIGINNGDFTVHLTPCHSQRPEVHLYMINVFSQRTKNHFLKLLVFKSFNDNMYSEIESFLHQKNDPTRKNEKYYKELDAELNKKIIQKLFSFAIENYQHPLSKLFYSLIDLGYESGMLNGEKELQFKIKNILGVIS